MSSISTARSRLPLPLKSPATMAPGRSLMLEPSLVEVVKASDGLAKPPLPSRGQNGEAVCALIDDHDVGEPARR